ncbi:hypothetical protein SEA_VANLEE_59 [Gordonia phage VanLee]|uniref:Uncharacterized protein n=1 Tax=Gordonia phage VanLee TaxID=2845816 RepID=A0A8F2IF73_9CAUD|nr:hypothetical protein QEH49_gp059 [Gordonia phage VanLee]QWS68176.1 hypothetical protein SEA_VANLEE_59 [Gordonia phage VanLee]
MSDPAVAAAQRAKRPAWAFVDPPGAAEDIAERGAREALAPLRARHKRWDRFDGAVCEHCEGGTKAWPCDDALDLYSTEELAGEPGA